MLVLLLAASLGQEPEVPKLSEEYKTIILDAFRERYQAERRKRLSGLAEAKEKLEVMKLNPKTKPSAIKSQEAEINNIIKNADALDSAPELILEDRITTYAKDQKQYIATSTAKLDYSASVGNWGPVKNAGRRVDSKTLRTSETRHIGTRAELDSKRPVIVNYVCFGAEVPKADSPEKPVRLPGLWFVHSAKNEDDGSITIKLINIPYKLENLKK